MGQSYRIRTEIGINKTINVQLDQDFDFIELLSLKLQQEDIYIRSCADYGVLVGRVTANNGFGIPNARVSIFIPIENIDESNPIVQSIYPYKSPTDKNEDGYRYNLLPYEKSYSKHAATGTLPTRLDVLTGKTAIEIYDKYYKFTAKTNDSGDYMIMGVPLGNQTVVMDLDLSDIGEFSLTPQDLIRMGLATEAQVSGGQFRSSNDLTSLPQIVSINKSIDVSPLWGEPDICQIAINRVDFDLRDDANIDIQPTSVFMGSIFSSPDNMRVRRNCKPRESMGNLCSLTTGPGQILALRQTIFQDSDGNPVLEQYQLEQSGNVIDGDGTWLIEVPMNLDYFITNEFGEKVLSNDPTIGIPTKGKYRFKVKWKQPETLTEVTRRAYFLVPNVKEYGWVGGGTIDPSSNDSTETQRKQQQSSYYFGLAWTGYTNGFTGQPKLDRLNEIINCDDTFYEMNYNRVYTVSGLIDQYKNGSNRGRFLGIKEIDSEACDSTVNKFPVNDGVRNFDLIYFLFSIIFQVIQLFGVPLLVIYHILAFLWNNFAVILLGYLIFNFTVNAVNYWYLFIGAVSGSAVFGATAGLIAGFLGLALLYTAAVVFLGINFNKIVKKKFGRFKIPMITYPECQACDCEPETTSDDDSSSATSLLTQVANSGLYYDKLLETNPIITGITAGNTAATSEEEVTKEEQLQSIYAVSFSEVIGTRSGKKNNNSQYRSIKSQETTTPNGLKFFSFSADLPLGERINLFNTRKKFFDNVNKISVCFNSDGNQGKNHFDNTLTVLTSQQFSTGTLLTFVNPNLTQDVNYLFSAVTTQGGSTSGIAGTPLRPSSSQLDVEYAQSQTQNAPPVRYFLSSGSTETRYKFPSDIEYYQVITAITVSDAAKIWSLPQGSGQPNSEYFPNLLDASTRIIYLENAGPVNVYTKNTSMRPSDYFSDFENQYITIIQRGVDPYSPLFKNKYGLGRIFGYTNENQITVETYSRLNIPIQKLTETVVSVQRFNSQDNIFYPSYFYSAGQKFSAFTTSTVGYYGALDATYSGVKYRKFDNQGTTGLVTAPQNRTYSNASSTAVGYSLAEDISGGSYLYTLTNGKRYRDITSDYYSPSLLPSLQKTPMNISTKTKNVLRTDRLPSSDYLDSSSWDYNPSLLQQNVGFQIYVLNTDGDVVVAEGFGSGGDTYSPDIEDQVAAQNVLESFNCINMVGLKCYSGNTTSFGIKKGCKDTDTIENGCYVFMARPLLDLVKDLKSFGEWGYRFRFFYGLCRGVLSQIFVNNWVNGSLYAYPIQIDTTFNKKNLPNPPKFCKEIVYFDSQTFNFYYRSSPYVDSTNRFVGRPTNSQVQPINRRQLQYPTTIINLGMKDSFYSEIIFEPSAKAYIVDQLDSTSYSDTSDLVNLFVISRISDEGFLQQLFAILNKNNSLDQLFSRYEKRIDGDLAQLLSINSEEGVINFSPEYYTATGAPNEPVVILGSAKNPTMGVFFSSTTEDLQFKDYLTPGRIDFRSPQGNWFPYSYGIKSQIVPFYQWSLASKQSIFGTQFNNWATQSNEIFSRNLQSLDRNSIITPNYFRGSNAANSDTFARGYIFNSVGTTTDNFTYSTNGGTYPSKFLVGAPYHFYFGIIKGSSALDKFKTKYSVGE